jgi:kinetochore protein NNF1
VPQALDGLHREFVGRLETMCKSEFQALMEEREVVASLNELDDLVAEARRRRERGGEESKVVP